MKPRDLITTVGNWKQVGLDVEYEGEVYRWSKHHEFLKFISLPRRVPQRIELAMNLADRMPNHLHANESVPAVGLTDDGRDLLEGNGWQLAKCS